MTDTHTALLEVPFVETDFRDLHVGDTVRIDPPWGWHKEGPTFWVITEKRDDEGEEYFVIQIVDGTDQTCIFGRVWDYTIPAISDTTEV